MAKKKKKKSWLGKIGKAAALAAAAYGASKMFGGRKGNVSKTAASEDANINVNPLKKWSPSVGGTDHIPRRKKWTGNQTMLGGDMFYKGGGIAKRGMGAAFKKGGHVNSMGIATRGGGAAKR